MNRTRTEGRNKYMVVYTDEGAKIAEGMLRLDRKRNVILRSRLDMKDFEFLEETVSEANI